MITINNVYLSRIDGVGIYYDFLEEQIVSIIEMELLKRGLVADVRIK